MTELFICTLASLCIPELSKDFGRAALGLRRQSRTGKEMPSKLEFLK